jgi:hypothetical protein
MWKGKMVSGEVVKHEAEKDRKMKAAGKAVSARAGPME